MSHVIQGRFDGTCGSVLKVHTALFFSETAPSDTRAKKRGESCEKKDRDETVKNKKCKLVTVVM